jgi:phospho-N-acetylmuramoyl-pentapeptide-transferase
MNQTSMTLALAGLGFMLTVIWGTPLLRILRFFNLGKSIRVDGPQSHFTKMGTPTMGGILIVLPVLLITVLLNASSLLGLSVLGRSILLPLGTMVVFAAIGAIDDWRGIHGKRGEGIRARTKFLAQLMFALIIGIGLRYFLDVPQLFLPGVKGEIPLGYFYIPITMIWIVGFSNAINLTDGLDGLAGLIAATAFASYGGIALLQKQVFLSRFPMVQCPSSRTIHGRYRIPFPWCHPGCGIPDDWSMGAYAIDRGYTGEHYIKRHDSDYIF